MLQQKIPALIRHQLTVDHHKRPVDQGAVQIQEAGDLLLSGPLLAADHHRLPGGGQRPDFPVHPAHGAADAVEAAVPKHGRVE